MASRIPEDFGSAWEMSDVVLHTQDSDGKELHANKAVLAVFSPYFQAMFFGNFKEANQNQITIDHPYSAVKEILRIIYQVDRDYSAIGGQKLYNWDMMLLVYPAADYLDFPVVRKMCEEQMINNPSVNFADIAYCFNRHDIMMKILTKLDYVHLAGFLSDSHVNFLIRAVSHVMFSKTDVVLIYQKVLPLPPRSGAVAQPMVLRLEEISKELENPRIDLTEKWPMSDIALEAKNSQGRGLYSNKAVMASVSPYFQKLFFENEEKAEQVVPVDVEYATMKQILSIVHNCNMDFSRNGYTLIHPVLLHDMYLAAAEDTLDILLIRQFCCDNLLEQPGVVTLEVVLKLGLDDVKSLLLKKLSPDDLRDWVLSEDKEVSYHRDGEEVVITTERQKLVLKADDLRTIFLRLSSAYGI